MIYSWIFFLIFFYFFYFNLLIDIPLLFIFLVNLRSEKKFSVDFLKRELIIGDKTIKDKERINFDDLKIYNFTIHKDTKFYLKKIFKLEWGTFTFISLKDRTKYAYNKFNLKEDINRIGKNYIEKFPNKII